MPYMRDGKCVYKKTRDGKKGKKKGCSKTVAKAKKYLKKLYTIDEIIRQEIQNYLQERKNK